MYGKRMVGVSALGLVLAAFGTASSAVAQAPQEPGAGLTYGGLKALDPVWLRLDPSRSGIASLEIPWAIARERCSNRKGYFSTLVAGYEWETPIPLNSRGKFDRKFIDRYRSGGTRYEETQRVTGTITDQRAAGRIRGRVKYVRPNGRVVRCTFGPQTWNAVN
jgi:hypothetical protein